MCARVCVCVRVARSRLACVKEEEVYLVLGRSFVVQCFTLRSRGVCQAKAAVRLGRQ